MPQIEDRLYGYIVKQAAEMNVYVYAINGWYDHVHLIVTIPPKYAVAEVVKQLKGSSAHYLNQLGEINDRFAWQRGYGVFSLGERQRPLAEEYVTNQKEHHRQQTTNPWLEYTAEHDEGPEDTSIASYRDRSVIRELPETYRALDETPF